MSPNHNPQPSNRNWVIAAVVASALTAALIVWLPSKSEINTILTDAGYSKIEITGRRLLGCDSKSKKMDFTAVDEFGRPVSGLVCLSPFSRFVVRVRHPLTNQLGEV